MDPRVVVAGAKDKKPPVPVWRRKRALIGAMAVLIVIIGVGVWNFYWRAPRIEPASKEKMALPLPDRPPTAVLPFVKKKGIPFNPTLSALYPIENKGVAAGIPAYAVEKTQRVKPHHLNSIRMAREAGVIVAAGTDAGTPFNEHGQNVGEMIFLVDQGYSPPDPLRAGTSMAAKVLGVEKDFGTVEEGKVADLVVVNGNPLEDMKVLLTSIAVVMQGGKVVRNDL